MAWLPRQWIVGGLLAAASIAGLFLARAAAGEAGYWAALLLSALCVVGVFAAIADAYDPLPLDRINSMPENGTLRYIVGGLVGAVGVFGLLRSSGAAASGGFVYDVGLSLFAVAVAYDFLLIKDWFDRTRIAAPDSPREPSGGSLRRGPAAAADR